MPTTIAETVALLNSNNIVYQLYEHPAVNTTEEAAKYCAHIPGAHVKNLFLRNKKKTAYWLITVRESKTVDLSALGDQLAVGALSFVNSNNLFPMLGVQPGSVTPLAIINDTAKQVTMLFDKDLLSDTHINIHPMQNTATLHLKLQDLLTLLEISGREKINFIEIPLR